MLFWLIAIGGFVALSLVQAAGFYFRLNTNLTVGVSTVIIMAAVWLSLAAKRADVAREKLAIESSSESLKPLQARSLQTKL
jgi:hypothetical protein